jgi:NAD(P)-dependent dehydrogenase (short-subunit alcohol dehydrogenase family)
MSMLLEGKSAVIMGAGSGVGRASALRFAEEGAKVVVADVDLERAKETVRLVEEAGGSAIADQCDVSQEADVEATIALAVSTFGRLDIIFNNVGVPTPRPGLIFEDHTVEDFDRLFAINAKGVFLGSKHAIRQFKQQGDGGVILNTGSVAGLVSWGGGVYGSTKGAVHQLTKAAAIEGAPFDIRCNAICPAGMPYTNFTNAMGMEVPEDQREQMAQSVGTMHPLGRPITAEDCAEAAVYLVSDRAANITGVLLPVDGGYVAR